MTTEARQRSDARTASRSTRSSYKSSEMFLSSVSSSSLFTLEICNSKLRHHRRQAWPMPPISKDFISSLKC